MNLIPVLVYLFVLFMYMYIYLIYYYIYLFCIQLVFSPSHGFLECIERILLYTLLRLCAVIVTELRGLEVLYMWSDNKVCKR